MMAQYLKIKAEQPEALLFYRMGDFYEMFFDDAVAAAEALDIALTKRGKHENADIPMCGVPVHSAEGYLLTLIRKGFRVAVCEQMESPAEAKKRGSKSVVRREVVRLVTPGTLTEDALLDARRHNYLAAYAVVRDSGALAWSDISTGAFCVMPVAPARLGPELSRLAPSELIVSEAAQDGVLGVADDAAVPVSPISRASFDSDSAQKRLCELFDVGTLDAFGSFSRSELSALGAVVDYLSITQRGTLPTLQPPSRETSDQIIQIDAATRRNLELTRALSGGRAGSLLSVVDRTLTASGGRLLETRLSSPSRDLKTIHARLAAVAHFLEAERVSEEMRDLLREAPDLERAVSRLSLDRGGPRDLTAVRAALIQGQALASKLGGEELPAIISSAADDLVGFEDLVSHLDNALVAEPPLQVRDGDFIATGHDAALDEARTLRDEGKSVIASFQRQFAEQTGIASLKVKHNNVLGYFVETTAAHAEKMLSPPLSETFIHRQTTANQVRFTTVELSDLETRIINAGNRALEIEKQLYQEIRSQILDQAGPIALAARALAEIDLTLAFAEMARQQDWCCPVVDDTRSFEIEGGRHPVVQDALSQQGGTPFIPNDCDLTASDGAAIQLLTGPNMAGKSTFLRQNALIALLAQCGSFVPADSARVGVVSQIFSRVGASDDLARGRSTFMVEMVETAAILNQADERALVILDEIGRGTATYDGLSIAWATLEHLHEVNKCRALFATHYHELTALAGSLVGVENATVAVKEWEGEVIFLHEVRKGAADRSYGVQVAQLAGLPKSVVARARLILEQLEKSERDGSGGQAALIDDLPLFSAAPPAPAAPSQISTELETHLAEIHPDDLTPKEALEQLYRLKEILRASEG